MSVEKRPGFFSWWKILTIILMLYTVVGGFLIRVPRQPIVHETIRNQYFHVSMWFAMMILLTISLVFSILYLRKSKPEYDLYAVETANLGVLMGVLGLITGMVWAQFTWDAWWNNDPKQTCAAIA